MSAHNPVEVTGNIIVHHPTRPVFEVTYADVFNLSPSARTWCGRFRCCREYAHEGSCEVDVTMLAPFELAAIAASRFKS